MQIAQVFLSSVPAENPMQIVQIFLPGVPAESPCITGYVMDSPWVLSEEKTGRVHRYFLNSSLISITNGLPLFPAYSKALFPMSLR